MYRQLIISVFIICSFQLFGQRADNNNWYKFQSAKKSKSINFQNNRKQHNALENEYDINFYWINLNVSSANTFIKGSTSIQAKVIAKHLDTIALELIPQMKIDSSFLGNSKITSIYREDNNISIPLRKVLEKDSCFTIRIYYHGSPPARGFFSGVSHDHNITWNKDVTWTLSEPFAAKDWFPVKQSLTDKADSAWIFLTTPPNEIAGSEGLLTKVINLPEGRKRYEWKTSYPIDYYLLSFAVANYQDYRIYAHPKQLTNDSLLIQNFVYNSPDFLNYNKNDIDQTRKIIELYSNLFGIYPFSKEKYGHCLTELGGGMEHQTMTTIGGFGFDLIAHELGHMWFGDNITCATWSDIWINEGFATYSNYLANEHLKGPKKALDFITKAQTHAISQPGGSIYIPEEEIYPGNEWRIFNGRLSYDKGAAILHMLRHEINNDNLFFNILKAYQKRFSGSVATGEDFKHVADSITGKDFTYFFNQWYYGEGYPQFNIKWSQTSDSLKIISIQTTSTQTTQLFRMFFDLQLRFTDGKDTLVRLLQTDTLNRFSIPITKRVSQITFDPNHWTLQKVNKMMIDAIPVINNSVKFISFPNPVTSVLHLRFSHQYKTQKQLVIYSAEGRPIFKTSTNKVQLNIDFKNYSRGIYIISAVAGGNRSLQKIVH